MYSNLMLGAVLCFAGFALSVKGYRVGHLEGQKDATRDILKNLLLDGSIDIDLYENLEKRI